MKLISEFCDELRSLGLSPVLDSDYLDLEFGVDAVEPKKVTALIDKYVGFFKSIGIKAEHSREERIVRYHIPVQWISGKDITDEQLLDISGKIAEKLAPFPVTKYWIDLMKHAIGYRPEKVKSGRYVAYRNYFATNAELPDWENMVQAGLAVKVHQSREIVYHLSDKGFEFLSDILGIQILTTEEESEDEK